MTPLTIGAPGAGASSAGSGSAATPAGVDDFASVLAGASIDPAVTNTVSGSDTVPVSAAVPGDSPHIDEPAANGAAGGRSGSHVRPGGPAKAANAGVLAADVAAAALALPVPVPVPVTPAAASAWSAGTQRAGADRPASPTAVQASPAASTLAAFTPAAATGAPPVMPPGAVPPGTLATGTLATGTLATGTLATGTLPATTDATVVSPAPQPSSPAGTPAPAQPSAAAATASTAPTLTTATRSAAEPAAQPAGTTMDGQPTGIRLAGQPTTPVTTTASLTSKPASIDSVVAHDSPANPLLAGGVEHQPNTGSGTGSGDRQHASDRSATPVTVDRAAPAGPSGSMAFTLDNGATNPSQSAAAAQPMPTQSMITAQPVTTAQPVSTSQPSTVSQQPTAAPVSHQLAGPVLSLRTAGDGNHQLTIALHPAELGPVNVHVRIVGDSMAIQLASNSAEAHDALREALPQLRQELQAAGLHNVDLHAVEIPAVERHAVERHAVDLSLDLGGSGAQAGARSDQGYHPGHHDGPPVDRPAAIVPADRLVRNTDSGLDRWL